MSETHDSAMFLDDERKWVRDNEGNILYLRTTPPIRPCLATQLAALGEPSQEFITMTRLMKLIKYKKGGDAVPLKSSSESM